jgi:hypothetical protein
MPNLAANLRQRLEAAGGEIVERSRLGIKARLPDGRFRLITTAGRRLHLDDGTEIDTDLDPGTGGWVAQARAALPYDIRIGGDGGRRLIPRKTHPDEYVQFGALESYNGSTWETVTLGTWERVANRIVWDRPNYALEVALLPETAKIGFVLKDPVADRPIRWQVTLVGLSWDAGTLISDSDSATVAWLRPPRWESSSDGDKAGMSGPVPWDYVGGYVRFDPDLPADVVYPVTIDPDVAVDIAAGADDGYVTPNSSSFNSSATAMYCGPSDLSNLDHTWLRFQSVNIEGTISAATIDLYTASGYPSAQNVAVYIWPLDEDDHAAPTSYNEWNTDHSNHVTGTAIQWDFNAEDTAGVLQTTDDFSSLLQEVVDRTGWSSGNDIGIHLDRKNDATFTWQGWASYENTTYDPATLDVTYSSGDATASPSAKSLTVAAGDSDPAAIWRPTSDIAATGWDTNPTPGGDLYAQIDEASASDTDFIDADGA